VVFNIENHNINTDTISSNSFLLVKLFVHELYGLDKLVRIITLNPLFKTTKAELLVFGGLLQPLEIVDEYLFPVLLFKHPVDQMAAEELEFDLAS